MGGRHGKGLEVEVEGVSEEGVKRCGGDGGGFVLGDLTGRGGERCDAGTLSASGAARRAGGDRRGRRAVVGEDGRRRLNMTTPWVGTNPSHREPQN